MYTQYFGLKERPFKLVPNPHYLYLSRSHEEALAHLAYAVSEGDGFLAVTGEVGTGKTTLCRSFIESLSDDKVVAYIFNPKLDALQLLKAINDEFEINSKAKNVKDLIDILNRFLMEKKQEGKTVILLIDEAQNLSIDVLEQIRLLSNLETTKEKLLQIILVGQPELMDMLDTPELRQLTQRITLRCHLSSLNLKEMTEYIEHRLNLASQKRQVKFTGPAFRAIKKFSNGTPRLVNMVCDRSLLTAFGMNKKKVTAGMVRAAVRELSGRGNWLFYRKISYMPVLASLFLLFLALAAFLVTSRGVFTFEPSSSRAISIPVKPPPSKNIGLPESALTENEKKIEATSIGGPSTPPEAPEADVSISGTGAGKVELSGPAREEKPGIQSAVPPEIHAGNGSEMKPEIKIDEEKELAAVTPENSPEPEPPAEIKPDSSSLLNEPEPSLEGYLHSIDLSLNRQKVLESVLDIWENDRHIIGSDYSIIADDPSFFALAGRKNGFSVYTLKNNFDLARRLNLPFILEVYLPEKLSVVYLAVYKIENHLISLKSRPDDAGITLSVDELKGRLGETAHIIWKNFYGYDEVIPAGSSSKAVLALKMQIRDMGFSDIRMDEVYDSQTRNVIQTIQEKYNLERDGIVGPLTKIALYNETAVLKIPHIRN